MALVATLQPLLSGSDAELRSRLVDGNAPKLLTALDGFFSRATTLQARRGDDTTAHDEAVTRQLQAETRAVFELYMRVADEATLVGAAENGVLHVTRLVPFCQLYAPTNVDAVRDLLDAAAANISTFTTTMGMLRKLYVKQLAELHTSVEQCKRGQVVGLLQSTLELSFSLLGMASTALTTDALMVRGRDLEQELSTHSSSSLLYALVRCYEVDLPRLQRHLAALEDQVCQDMTNMISDVRHALLLVLGRSVDALMKTQHDDGPPDGKLVLTMLHALSSCCEDDEADHGSFLSDLWYLCEYKETVREFFEHCEMDFENFSYLDMVVEALPRRRVLPASLLDAIDAESKPAATSSASAKEWQAQEGAETVETQSETLKGQEDTGALDALVHQVKDFFPDLGEGYIELCLLSSEQQVEVVINFLLESNPPPALLDVPRDLDRSGAEFRRFRAVVTGVPVPGPEPEPVVAQEESKKLDPSRVWVGKKAMEKEYDPQIAKKDRELAEKMKQFVVIYDEEDEFGEIARDEADGDDAHVTLDEYDDDYNDEFEDYVPFSVHDNGSADNPDAIREQNRRMRAKEEKDAFWEGMKNQNHQFPAGGDKEEEMEEKEEVPAGDQKRSPPRSSGRGPPSSSGAPGAKHKSTRRKDKKPGTEADKPAEAPTLQQQQRARARKDKNKAKVANHNRKDRALKKMG